MWHFGICVLLACVHLVAGGKRSFTLPLYSQDTEAPAGNFRRRLLRNTTLPLHGAVKDYGYFYASLYLGSPPKKFAVIVDTGSTMTYVPCATCGSACGPNHQDAAFDPRLSRTSKIIPCDSDKCRCGSPHCTCSDVQQCMYTRSYAEQSSSSGILLEDVVALHDGGPGVPVIFGCETRETGEIFKQRADGLFGLGNSDASVVNQLVAAGEIEDVFALCFGVVEGDGVLVLGDSPAVKEIPLQYTPLVSSPTHPFYYNVRLGAISVGGDKLDIAPAVFLEGYATVLDSGTTFTYIPSPAFRAFSAAVEAYALQHGLVRVRGPDPQYDDICFGGAPDHTDVAAMAAVFPSFGLHFAPGVTLTLGPLNYLFVHTFNSGKYCLGVFDNGHAGTLLGGITFRNVLVQYDRGNKRVGFGPAQCKDLGRRHRPPCSAFSVGGNELAAIVAVADGDCQPEQGAKEAAEGPDDDDYSGDEAAEGDEEHEVVMPTTGAATAAAKRPATPAGKPAAGGGAADAEDVDDEDEEHEIVAGGGKPAGATSSSSSSSAVDSATAADGNAGKGGASSAAQRSSDDGDVEYDDEDTNDGASSSQERKRGGGTSPVAIGLLATVLAVLTVATVVALLRPGPREAVRSLLPSFRRYQALGGDDPESGTGSGGGGGGGGSGLAGGKAGLGGQSGAPSLTPSAAGKSGALNGAAGSQAGKQGSKPSMAVIAMSELAGKGPTALGELRVLGLTTPQKLQRTNSNSAAAAAAAIAAQSLADEIAAQGGVTLTVTPRTNSGMGQGLTPRASASAATLAVVMSPTRPNHSRGPSTPRLTLQQA